MTSSETQDDADLRVLREIAARYEPLAASDENLAPIVAAVHELIVERASADR